MPIPPQFAEFWDTFAREAGGVPATRFYEAFAFGDSAALAKELAELVLNGTKQATAGSL